MAKRDSHTYNSGRITRAGDSYAGTPAGARRGPGKKKPRSGKRIALLVTSLVLVVLVGAGAIGGLYMYFRIDNALDTGETGTVAEEFYTPSEYKGQVLNILVVGVYREDKEKEIRPRGLGLTDMILYVSYDLVDNKITMLQIPRDSYPGEYVPVGSEGKINGAMVMGEDKDNPINNLVSVISSQYQLPVDRYICMDMEALMEIVEVFGAIQVYVPRDMDNGKGSRLEQGWRWLDPDAVEFFVRNRYGAGFERADIDRLENQRHFYSALFRRFMNLSITDAMKLIPVFEYRCSTDFALNDLFDLAVNVLKLDSSAITFITVPGATRVAGVWEADPTGLDRDVFVTDIYGRGTEEEPGLPNILNTYFRKYAEQISDEELRQRMIAGGMPNIQIPSSVALYPPSIQNMGEVIDSEEGGADYNVEPG